jgi:hypothetical protein
MREDRFVLGTSPDVPDVWSHPVLRQLAESTRQQTRPRQWPPGGRISAAWRTLVVLLSRRGLSRILRDISCSSTGEMMLMTVAATGNKH